MFSTFISRGMPAGIAAYCRERLIRLKPGLLINAVQI
jgi:hypothetical protein